jgi:hypothetical protein
MKKRTGMPIPYIIVTKVTFMTPEYLKWIIYSGPLYKSMYNYREVFLVLYSSLVHDLSILLKTHNLVKAIPNSITGKIALIIIV